MSLTDHVPGRNDSSVLQLLCSFAELSVFVLSTFNSPVYSVADYYYYFFRLLPQHATPLFSSMFRESPTERKRRKPGDWKRGQLWMPSAPRWTQPIR